MNTDFRVTVTFTKHLKTRRLIRRLGHEAVFCLLQLWTYAAMYSPKGSLADMTAEEVEEAAEWAGTPGEFVRALLDLRFLDEGEDGALSLHNWEERNTWAANAQERSENARKAINARWAKRDEAERIRDVDTERIRDVDTERIRDVYTEPDTERIRDVYTEPDTERIRDVYTPSPSPSPSPALQQDPPLPPPAGGGAVAPCPQKDILALYHEALPTCPKVKVWPKAAARQLADRWREDAARRNLDWWRGVFAEVGASDFLMGRSGKGFTFSLTWFVKPENFAKVLNGNYANRDPPPDATPLSQKLTARQAYMLAVGNHLEDQRNAEHRNDKPGTVPPPPALPGGGP